MILITGGAFQGKARFASEHYPWMEILPDYHLTVREQLAAGLDPVREAEKIAGKPDLAVICDEIGCGVVPVNEEERKWREAAGRVQCLFAEKADDVVRVVCGIGQYLKRARRVTLLRHGIVQSNLERRFIGRTDQPLIPGEAGRLRAMYPDRPGTALVYVSPLRRCRETAEALFPEAEQAVEPDLQEMDFGIYENKNHEELSAYPDYLECIRTGERIRFPGGETTEGFIERCAAAFQRIMKESTGDPVFVVHGGTIMSVMDRFAEPHGDYYSWLCRNGCGYQGFWNPERQVIRGIHEVSGRED